MTFIAVMHLSISGNFVALFAFCGAKKEKANTKSLGKGRRGCRGGRKEPFPKGFSFPLAGKVPQM